MIVVLKNGKTVEFTKFDDDHRDKFCREVMRNDKGFIDISDSDTGKVETIVRVSEIIYVGPLEEEE